MKQNIITNFKEFWQHGGNWIVEIPKFQRSYKWNKKMILQMLDDIESIDLESEHIEKIFFGSMYFMTKEGEDSGYKYSINQVIDGQQRLLTIFIMLIVIHNEEENIFKSNGFSLFNPGNQSNRVRFMTNVGNDQNDINHLLTNNNGNSSNNTSNIFKCYKIIKKFFKEKTKDFNDDTNSKNKYFSKFFDKLTNCEFSINNLDDDNNMFQVFQSINAKTLPLTLEDILNNYITEFTQENERIQYIWDSIREEYENKLKNLHFKFEYLLRYFFQYKFEKDIKINQLLNVFCKEYNDSNKVHSFLNLFKEFIDFVISLSDDQKYSNLFNDKKIILGQLFFCYKEYPNMYDKFKDIMYSYLIRRNICEYDTKGVTAIFPTLIPSIIKNDNDLTINKIKSFFEKLNGKNATFPNNTILKEKILNTNFYYKKNICLPILKMIEKISYGRVNIDWANLEDVTIDHVWEKSKYKNICDNLDDDMKYKIVNSIGNLTLLPRPINSSLARMNFNQKKEYYIKEGSLYKMNSYFRNITSWNVNEIQKRSEKMCEFIIELFPSVFSM